MSSPARVEVLLDRTRYAPGEVLTGRVIVHADEAVVVAGNGVFVRFRGFEIAKVARDMLDPPGRGTVSREASVLSQDRMMQLDSVSCAPGKHAFPFSMQLDHGLPASFEYAPVVDAGRPFSGRLYYQVHALVLLASPEGARLTAHADFAVERAPDRGLPEVCARSAPLSCWCFSRGTMEASVALSQREYAPGDTIRVTITVDAANTGLGVRNVWAALVHNAQFDFKVNVHAANDFVAEKKFENLPQKPRHELVFEVPAPACPTAKGDVFDISYRVPVLVRPERNASISLDLPVVVRVRAPNTAPAPLPLDCVQTLPSMDLTDAPVRCDLPYIHAQFLS